MERVRRAGGGRAAVFVPSGISTLPLTPLNSLNRGTTKQMSDDSDDEKQPFEYAAESARENKSQQKRSSRASGSGATKKQKQITMDAFTKKKEVSDDDDDDDSDDDGLKFNFGQHKPSKEPPKPSRIPSMERAAVDGAAGGGKKKGSVQRVLVNRKWSKGMKPLPQGWSANYYKQSSASDKCFWVFSHPRYGEEKNEKVMRTRTDEEWRAQLGRRYSHGGSSKREEEEEEEEAGDDDDAADDDPLAALCALAIHTNPASLAILSVCLSVSLYCSHWRLMTWCGGVDGAQAQRQAPARGGRGGDARAGADRDDLQDGRGSESE